MSSRFFRRDSSKTKSDKSNTADVSSNNGNPLGGGGGGGGNNDNNNKRDFSERKALLTPLEYRVTQERETERPFSNKYNRHWESGTYHCVVCHAELFQSSTKFESKSGWPAFYNVVDPKRVRLTADLSHIGANLLLLIAKPDLARTEVSCANCHAHLGHLFKDGPKPTGLRYCINSSSLHFTTSSSSEDPPPPLADDASTESRNNAANANFQEFPCNPQNSCGLGGRGPSSNNVDSSKSSTLPPMATLCLNNSQCQKTMSSTKPHPNSRLISSNTPPNPNTKPGEERLSQSVQELDHRTRPPPPKPNINQETSPARENPMFPKCTSYKSNANVNTDDTTSPSSPPRQPTSASTPTLNSPFGVRGSSGYSSGRYPSSKGASLTAARINFFQRLDAQPQSQNGGPSAGTPNSNSTTSSPSRSSFRNRFVASASSGSLGLRRISGDGVSTSNDNQEGGQSQNGNGVTSSRSGSGPHGFALLAETVSSAPNPLKETVL